MNHYQRNVGDYLRDTLGLSMEQDGAYTRLLDVYYASEKPLPLDRNELYGIARCRTPAERKSVDAVLVKFFTKTTSGFRQKRCDVELDEMIEKSRSASRSAKTLWSKRNANASQTHSEGNANVEQTPSDGNARQEPRTKNQEPEEQKAARVRATLLPPDFGISESVRAWSEGKNYGDLAPYLEFFVGRYRANGKKYLDWDQVFMNAVREDWYHIRSGQDGHHRSGFESRISEQERVIGALTGRKGRTIEPTD